MLLVRPPGRAEADGLWREGFREGQPGHRASSFYAGARSCMPRACSLFIGHLLVSGGELRVSTVSSRRTPKHHPVPDGIAPNNFICFCRFMRNPPQEATASRGGNERLQVGGQGPRGEVKGEQFEFPLLTSDLSFNNTPCSRRDEADGVRRENSEPGHKAGKTSANGLQPRQHPRECADKTWNRIFLQSASRARCEHHPCDRVPFPVDRRRVAVVEWCSVHASTIGRLQSSGVPPSIGRGTSTGTVKSATWMTG